MIDGIIWTRQHPQDFVIAQLDEVQVPVGWPCTAVSIVKDPHFLSREMLEAITLHSESHLTVPGVMPKLSRTLGRVGGGDLEIGNYTR